MAFQERYHIVAMAANSSMTMTGNGIGGFVCTVAGTVTITGASGTVLLNAFPVAAGQVYGIPALTGVGAVIQLAGGAAGSLLKQ